MSIVGGVFSETQLLDTMVRADALAFDDRIKQQFIPKIEVLKAIKSIQNARIKPLIGVKDRDIQLMWMNTCDIVVSDDTSCEFDGESASTNVQEVSIANPKAVQWYVDETDYDDNYFDIEEGLAKSMLKAEVALLEWLAAYSVGALNTFRGVNVTAPEGKGDIQTVDTYIQAAYWNPSLMAYFNRAAIMNQFSSPVMVTGNNLYESIFLAKANSANADGKGDAILYGGQNWFVDLFNIDTVNDPTFATYMINQGAVAIAHKTYLKNTTPEVVNGVFSRWMKPSILFPGIDFEVFYKPECTTGNRIKHNFKMLMNAQMFLNPTGCVETNTGVLRFVCGVPEN